MPIGEKIRKIRQNRNMTLDDLAKSSGVAKATLSRMENDLVGGNFKTFNKVAQALGVSLDDLKSEAKITNDGNRDSDAWLASLKQDAKELKELVDRISKKLNI